jgi:hypothetical protein
LLAVVLTLRLTVLDAGYDATALDRTNAYERVYTQVLPDPQVAAFTRDLLAKVRVPPTLVTANVRLLLPPSTLRQVTHRELVVLTDYLLGRRDRLDLLPGLTPVTDDLATTAADLLRGVVATQPHQRVATVTEFRQELGRFIAQLTVGHVPRTLPTIALGPDDAQQVTKLLLARLDPTQQAVLGPQVRTLLASGDLTGALTLVSPTFFGGPTLGTTGFEQQVTRVVQTLQAPAQRLRHRPSMQVLAQTRSVVSLGTATVLAVLVSVFVGLLVAAAVLTRRAGDRWVRTLLATLAASTLAAGVTGVVLGSTLPDPLRALVGAADTPMAVARLLRDVDDQLRTGIRHLFLLLVLPPVLVAVAAASIPWLIRFARTRSWSLLRRWQALQTGLAVTAGASVAAVVITPPANGPLLCNGAAVLCARSYAAVSYLAAHNAMASSDARFLGAEQDQDVVGQLNAGVRDLMLDTHYWSTPGEVTAYLDRLPERTRTVLRPLVEGLSTPRPGVWLCHDLCQLGAVDAVTVFRQIRGWLAANPHDVLTLDIEDHTTPADTERAILSAGLKRYLYTPPEDPDGAWPTLRQMITSGHRLVVFSERHDEPGGWLRSLFRYAAETPWNQTDPRRLTCDPGRGRSTGTLFLLNHYVTGVAPSRRDAAALNRASDILATARRCEQQRRMRPTYIAVDFVTTGDPLRAVNALNGVASVR